MDTEKSDILIRKIISDRYKEIEQEQPVWSDYEDRVMARIARRRLPASLRQSILDKLAQWQVQWLFLWPRLRPKWIIAEVGTAVLVFSYMLRYLASGGFGCSVQTYIYMLKWAW